MRKFLLGIVPLNPFVHLAWSGRGGHRPSFTLGPSVEETDQTPLQRKLRVGDFLLPYSRGKTGQIMGDFLDHV